MVNYRAQEALTVLVSGIIFTVGGYWLAPNQMKGAIIGAGASLAVSTGHVRQNRILRQLSSRQSQLSTRQQQLDQHYQESIQKLNTLDISRMKPGQTTLNRKEINAMQRRLEGLEGRFYTLSEAQANLPTPPLSNPEIIDAEEEELQEEKIVQGVIAWFTSKNIDIENSYQPDPIVDKFLDGLSLYLGDNYSVLRVFHRKLKSSIGKRIHFGLRDFSTTECSIHHEYLQKLRASALLSFGRYFKDDQNYILAATHNRKDIQGFLNGGWFERFIYYKVVEAFDAEGIDYQYLRNPTVVYPNEDGSEVDLFFLANGNPLLIECKSGQNYDEGIEKFVSHCKKLNLEPNNAIFVVLDLDESQASLRTKKWNITVLNENGFIDYIQDLAKTEGSKKNESTEDNEDEKSEEDLEESELTELERTGLSGFFKKQKLNLAPEYRRTVFAELIQLFEKPSQPMNFNEITKTIRDRLKNSTPLARNKINEILNTILASNYFRNQRNKPERNVSKPIFRLHKSEIEILENKAMEYYAKQVLQRFDPDFFDEQQNIEEFERLTFGKAPSPEKILEIKQR